MHQLEGRGRGARGAQLLAHVVFDRLHVMIDARFDGLDGSGGERIRRARQRQCPLTHGGAELRAGQARRGGRQVQEPLRLDAYALADEPGLRERGTQRGSARAVATIDRGERIQRGKWLVGGPRHALRRPLKC